MTTPSSKKHILVAEDDEGIRSLLTHALGARYEVRVVPDGATAIARLSERPVPDLLILDVMMPGADGYTVARHAKQLSTTSRVPIIFLTAKSSSSDVLDGIRAGARHYVTKPFQISDLLAKVAKILGT